MNINRIHTEVCVYHQHHVDHHLQYQHAKSFVIVIERKFIEQISEKNNLFNEKSKNE